MRHSQQLDLLQSFAEEGPCPDHETGCSPLDQDALRRQWNRQYRRLANKPAEMRALLEISRFLEVPVLIERDTESEVMPEDVAREIGVRLKTHHAMNAAAMTKESFEGAFEAAFRKCGYKACRAPNGNPGHDLTVEGVKYSLKTQADAKIRAEWIDIHKQQELGSGEWGDQPEHFVGLMAQVKEHLKRYDKILVFRRLKSKTHEIYELVEVPHELYHRALECDPVISQNSGSRAKPATIELRDEQGVMLKLYFDGGGERKLKVQNIRKSLCNVHARWSFARQPRL